MQKGRERLAADGVLEHAKGEGAVLVDHRREHRDARLLGVRGSHRAARRGHAVLGLQALAQQVGPLHESCGRAVDVLDEAAREVVGEAFGEPEVVPRRDAHEVAGPVVRHLVHRDVPHHRGARIHALVHADDRRVLHAAADVGLLEVREGAPAKRAEGRDEVVHGAGHVAVGVGGLGAVPSVVHVHDRHAVGRGRLGVRVPVVVGRHVQVVDGHRRERLVAPRDGAVGVRVHPCAPAVREHRERRGERRAHGDHRPVPRVVAHRQPRARARRPVEREKLPPTLGVALHHHEPAGVVEAVASGGALHHRAAVSHRDLEARTHGNVARKRHHERSVALRRGRRCSVDGDRVHRATLEIEGERGERARRDEGAGERGGEGLVTRPCVRQREVQRVGLRVDVGQREVRRTERRAAKRRRHDRRRPRIENGVRSGRRRRTRSGHGPRASRERTAQRESPEGASLHHGLRSGSLVPAG